MYCFCSFCPRIGFLAASGARQLSLALGKGSFGLGDLPLQVRDAQFAERTQIGIVLCRLTLFRRRRLALPGPGGGASGLGRWLNSNGPMHPLGIVTREIAHAGRIEHEQALGKLVEKKSIVTDAEDRSRITFQSGFQRFARGNIQMIGRLIEKQDVWLIQQQLGQPQARALPRR